MLSKVVQLRSGLGGEGATMSLLGASEATPEFMPSSGQLCEGDVRSVESVPGGLTSGQRL